MVGFGLVHAEDVSWLPPSPERPFGTWSIGNPTPLIDKISSADSKLSEWSKKLDEKRKAHHRNVIVGFFNRLYGEDIWPDRQLFSGKCMDSKRLLEETRTLVAQHLPPRDRERALYSGSVEIVGDPPRMAYILADTNGAGRLVMGA
jgi:hypothetical protein